MGNADIRSLAAIEDVSFDDLGGSVVAVDAHNWLYRYLTTTVKFTADGKYTTSDGEEVANLISVVQGLPKFFEHDLTPVFVFDGAVTDLKDDEVEKRREQRERYEEELETAREKGDATRVAKLDSRTQRLTETIVTTTRELLGHLDVPVVDAPAEGEGQASYMARRGDVDYVGTEDYDALLFGAPFTLRQLPSSDDPELMEFEATLAQTIVLAFFLTLVLGLGESVSMQSMTLSIQALRSVRPTLRWYLEALSIKVCWRVVVPDLRSPEERVLGRSSWAISGIRHSLRLSARFVV
jgi:flap endonuclease-1